MFIGINIYIDSRNVDYDYMISNNRLYISFKIDLGKKKLIIHYDDNIYDDFKVETGNYIDKDGYLEIDLTKNNLNFFEFSLKANYKYYVKLVYEQVNHNYSKEELIKRLQSLYDLNKEDEVLDRINVLKELKDNNLDDKFLYYEIDKLINDILINNPYYDKLMSKMEDYDVLNIITANIYSNKPYSITQEEFDRLVVAAKTHNYAQENLWRLAMNYDTLGYDYSKIEEYIVETKDIYSLQEYVSAIYQKNMDYLVDLIIKTKDNKYVKEVLDNEFINRDLSSEQKDKLKSLIKGGKMEEEKKCTCGPDCTCGCQEGKECTCNDPDCKCDDTCTCGCHNE